MFKKYHPILGRVTSTTSTHTALQSGLQIELKVPGWKVIFLNSRFDVLNYIR